MNSSDKLRAMSEEFVEVSFRLEPVTATLMGIHDYDALYPNDTPEGFEERLGWVRDFESRLDASVALEELAAVQRVDLALLRSRIAAMRIRLESIREHSKNPARFPETAMMCVFLLYARPFAPLDERKEALLERLMGIPAYLEGAQRTIERAPELFAKVVAEVNLTGPSFVDEIARGMTRSFPAEAEHIEFAAARARVGFSHYQEFLEKDLAARIGGSHAIGEPAMNDLLAREHLLGRTAAEIEAIGLEHIERTREQLAGEARRADPSRDWRQQVADAKRRHPEAARVRDVYVSETERARRFVLDRKIAPIPAGSLEILDTPVFERPFIPYATYVSPGPFDVDQTGLFYVTPIDRSRSREEQLEQLEGHNSATIPLVVLHESYPGHHLQRLHANRAPTRIRQLAESPFFVAGWTLYCEEMMWEQGFFEDPASRLIQLKDLLFRVCRAVIDVRLHTGRMEVDRAVDCLVEDALLERSSALAEVRRYALTPTLPMGYLVGKLDLLAIRDEARRRLGDRFSLHDFHAGLLAGGALPPSLVRDELWERVGAT